MGRKRSKKRGKGQQSSAGNGMSTRQKTSNQQQREGTAPPRVSAKADISQNTSSLDCDELSLWKVSERMNRSQARKLGVKLRMPLTKLQNLNEKVQRGICSQEEMNFEMLHKWNANQIPDDDPEAQLCQMLKDLEFPEKIVQEIFTKENHLHQSTQERVLSQQQLCQIADKVDRSQHIPIVLRLGLSFNDFELIKQLCCNRADQCLFTLLHKWQKELPPRTDQIETISSVLAASEQKRLAHNIRNNCWNVIRGDNRKSIMLGTETCQTSDWFCDKDLIINCHDPAKQEQMLSKMSSMFEKCSSKVELSSHGETGTLDKSIERVKKVHDECQDVSRFLDGLQEAGTQDRMYEMNGATISSIILHVRVYSEEGLRRLKEDINSGAIGRRLASVLMSHKTGASSSDDEILNITLAAGTIDHIAQQSAGKSLQKMENWGEEEVKVWLRSVVLFPENIVSKFDDIDGFTLLHYTKDQLQEDFGLSNVNCRKLEYRLQEHLQKEGIVKASPLEVPSTSSLTAVPLSTPPTLEEAVPQQENMQEASSTSPLGDMVSRGVEDIGRKSTTTTSSRGLPGPSPLTKRTSCSEDLDTGYTSSYTTTTPNPSEVDFEVKGPLYQRAEKGGEVSDPSTEKKLTNLLLGSDKGELDSSYYPVLVVNAPTQQMSSAELKDKFGFMSSVNWNVVFDCDADSNKLGLCQYVNQMKAIKILNAEKFTETKDRDTLREDIDFPEVPVWVFPNGRNDVSMKGMEKMSDIDWMRERSNAVLETVRFFSDPGVIPSGRAVVVFLLLSFSDIMVMTQLFREFYTSKSFKDLRRFTIIAENRGILHKWIQHLDSQSIVSSKNIRDRCLEGVKWQEINTYMMRLLGSSQTCLPELHMSPKGQCQLMKKHQSQWSDISVLAKNECENTSMDVSNPNFLDFVQEKELRFYQGHEVDWWNFYLSEERLNDGKGYNQVLKRQSYHKLYSAVQKVLASRGKKVNHISMVTVFHEAGSGGTTVAKNLLWDLHKDYRCAVVNRVTSDTVNQIVAFRKYGYEEDQNPGPAVILLENVDSESMRPFLVDLERETRYIEDDGLAFVLVHCKRTAEPKRLEKKEEPKPCASVQHELTEKEKKWFTKKTKDLEKRSVFSEKDSPERLLAFMVMKEGCDSGYLEKVVKGILQSVGKKFTKELNLLKYIAVVQMYNPDFAMPVSACDGVMQNRFMILSSGGLCSPWEKNRLPFLNQLLRDEFIHDIDGCVKGLSVVHPIIASEIVKQLGEFFEQSPADMVLELLEKSTILDTLSYSKGYIQKVCRDLMVRRLKKEYGDDRETDFSPFIEDVYAEDKAKAFKIMEVGIEKLQDPFIAQQKARLHSKRDSDYESAEQAINIALHIVSNNSYLWDTKGIILREKMIKYERKDQTALTDDEMKELLDTFNESCKAFQNAQKAMEEETTRRNYAGFVGEITTITKFLDIVQKSVRPFSGTGGLETLRRYLMTEYIPFELTLPSLLEFSDTMKTLSERVDKALGRFTDYLAHCAQQRFGRATYRIYDEKLEKIYNARNRFFACQKLDVHAHYPVETVYAMRRAEVMRMNADGYQQIFELASKGNVVELTRVQELLRLNLVNPNLFDIKNFVFTVFALSVCTNEGLDEDEARKSVITLKRMEERKDGFYGLFFEMLLNWPDGTTRKGSTPIADTLWELRAKWNNRYRNKGYEKSMHNLPRRSKIRQQSTPLKPATEFYLGLNEKSRFVPRKSMGLVSYPKWKEESVKTTLKRFDGVLHSKDLVLYHPDGQEPVKIPLSLPLKGLPSQEQVHFYIGFTFAGPLAYDVAYKDSYRKTPFIAKESSANYPSYVNKLDDNDEGCNESY